MKEFRSFGAFAAHMLKREIVTIAALHMAVDEAAQRIEDTAKEELGTYQPEVGPFPAWAELAEYTKADRLRQGYTENDPLLRSGEMRDSIKHESAALEAVIGSESLIARYQELGTGGGPEGGPGRIPPRPFLGPAAVRNEKGIVALLGAVAVAGLAGGQLLPGELGYGLKSALKD